MRNGLIAAMMTLGIAVGLAAQSQPLLQLQGQPYFDGSMTLQLSGTVGQPALLAYGLDPLSTPLQTGKGPWFIGSIVNLIALGNIPASGRIDMPFTMPPLMPAFAGIPIVMQGYVPFQLSNPAILPLDVPYFVPSFATVLTAPAPQQSALFGDKFGVGDLNDDGVVDIAVGAPWEDVSAIDKAGAVHVFWGPSFSSETSVYPPVPVATHYFGLGLVVMDVDGDLVDDLVVGEAGGDPPQAGAKGHIRVFKGGPSLPATPTLSLTSLATGAGMGVYGRILRAGDLNGDGAVDLIAGVPYSAPSGMVDAGHIEIFYGPMYQETAEVFSPSPHASDFFGDAVAIGDATGDGIADLLEASGREDAGDVKNIGRAYAFDGPTLQPILTLENPLPAGANSRFGNALVAVDTNGDGLVEIVATDQRDHAFVFMSPEYSSFALVKRAPTPGSAGGTSVSFGYFAAAGDANGDGLIDFLIGEPFGAGVGRVHIALGPYWSTLHVLMDKVPASGAEFGWGVAMEDVDADGSAELIVGSDLAPVGPVPGAGHVTIFDIGQ